MSVPVVIRTQSSTSTSDVPAAARALSQQGAYEEAGCCWRPSRLPIRLDIVSDGTDSATDPYVANSPLGEEIIFKHDEATRMTTTKPHDTLNRLNSITNEPGDAPAIGYRYGYNAANPRTTMTNSDGSRRVYIYDKLARLFRARNTGAMAACRRAAGRVRFLTASGIGRAINSVGMRTGLIWARRSTASTISTKTPAAQYLVT